MEGSTEVRSWLRCYRCWSQNLEVQVHYEGIHRIDPFTGERAEVVDEMQEAVVQCLECMHDQPHLGFHNGRVEPIEDRWERMIVGTPWVASCTVEVDAEDVEQCSGEGAGDSLSYAAFGDNGTREFFTHVRFHKHDEEKIVVHLLVELYARSLEEATEVLEDAARGELVVTSLAEESRPAGLHRPRRPLSPPPTAAFPQLHHDQRQGDRDGRRQVVIDEEQQVEPGGDGQRPAAPPATAWRVAAPRSPRAGRPRTGLRSPRVTVPHCSDWSWGNPWLGTAAVRVVLGAWSVSVLISHTSATAIATIPSLSHPGGVTVPSNTPRVTQERPHSSVPAPSPHRV